MKQAEITKVLNDTTLSKSKKFILLYNEGMEIKEIASLFSVRYNFVYNVISNFCRINDVELRTNKVDGSSKKAQIVELFKQGKSNTEIAKALKTNYNYVYKITKEMM
jgi:transposase